MRQKSQTRQTGAAKAIKDIRRATRKQYSAEEKIRKYNQNITKTLASNWGWVTPIIKQKSTLRQLPLLPTPAFRM